MNGKLHKRRAEQIGGPRRSQKSAHFGELRLYSRRTELEIGREALNNRSDWKPALARLLARDQSGTDFVLDFVPGPGTLNKIPTTASERGIVASEVEKYITEKLRHRLSRTDFELFRRYRLDPPDEAALSRIYAAMNEVIFQAAVEQGPTIFLVPEILQRVADWTIEGDNGARCWKRLGKYFAQFALVTHGAKASLVPWVGSRSTIIQEIRKLRRFLQARFPERLTLLANWVLLNAAEDAVEAEPGMFPKLGAIKFSFQLFVNTQPESLLNLVAGHLTPALFTDQLIGWITNYEPGSVAQLIRRLSK